METGLAFKTFEKSIRLFAGAFICIYAFAKPWQFPDSTGITTPVGEMAGMTLMWSFFGYSKIVPIIIGVFELTGALLLVFDKTKLLGALLLAPIMFNIAMFDVVYEVSAIPTVNAFFYLAVVMLVLFFEREKLKSALGELVIEKDTAEVAAGFSLKRILLMVGFLFLNFFVLILCFQLGHILLKR